MMQEGDSGTHDSLEGFATLCHYFRFAQAGPSLRLILSSNWFLIQFVSEAFSPEEPLFFLYFLWDLYIRVVLGKSCEDGPFEK